MGCAPSRDAVFEYKASARETSAYNHQRRSSAASVVLSAGKGSASKQKKRKSSSSSSSSNDSHHSGQNIETLQTSKRTETNWVAKTLHRSEGEKIQDTNYNHTINNASDRVTQDKDKFETTIAIGIANVKANGRDEQFNHEQLQSETFITGNYRRDESVFTESDEQVIRKQVDAKSLSDSNRTHEERAKYLEQKRAAFDSDKKEEEFIICRYDPPLLPLNMKDQIETSSLPIYTVDDIVAHNESVKSNEWFRMGRRVFCRTVMMAVVENRLRDIERRNEMAIDALNAGGGWHCQPHKYFDLTEPEYPPYLVRRGNALSRKELAQVLCCCVIGKHENVSRDWYVSSLKESVEDVLEDLNVVNDGADSVAAYFKNQLTRWLNRYPDVPLGEYQLQKGSDPNSVAYQLPKGIDPSLLRAWVADFVWDTELDHNIWDNSEPVFTDLCKDSMVLFTNLVASSRDSALPEIDHTIEGAVPWSEIDQDLFKNDVCTPAQEEIWNKRSSAPPKSEAWMENRRNAIAVSFYTRHDWEPEKVTPYLDFVDTLRKSWVSFQELCQKPWNPPPRKNAKRNESSPNTNDLAVPVEGGRTENVGLQPKFEAMDSGLDLESNVDCGRASR